MIVVLIFSVCLAQKAVADPKDKPGVYYTLQVHTGDWPFAGTTNIIFFQLYGTGGERLYANPDGYMGFSQGSVRQFETISQISLGDIIMIEITAEQVCRNDSKWFCEKIFVKASDGELLFPCYRWVDPLTKLFLRPAKGLFMFEDINPIGVVQRMGQLEESRSNFRWDMYIEGSPYNVKALVPSQLPKEVQYSVSKAKEFSTIRQNLFGILRLKGFENSRSQWNSFQELDQAFNNYRTPIYEYVRDHWMEDEFFGHQFLNGLNPMMIKRCSRLPVNFPVTDDLVQHSLPGTTLEAEMKSGTIFLCDYKMLHGLEGNVIHGRQQYIAAPLVLLHCNPQGQMLPIAIQLMQIPGTDNPIFVPSDPLYDWLLAKIFVRNAEFLVHELDFHLLRTHLLAEVFAMATYRNLPTTHPLFKLLIPHMRFTLHINTMARNLLISDDGVFSQHTSLAGESMTKFMKRATASLTYSSLCLPDDLAERGLENVPNFYYRDDGIRLWNIIRQFAGCVLMYYYKSDSFVQKDTELQRWINEIFNRGFLGKKNTGIPQTLKCMPELIKITTMIIFTSSVQHAAINGGQSDYGAWMPNFPSTMREPPPRVRGQSTEQSILRTLPFVGTTGAIRAILQLLSTDFIDYHPLGYFPEEWFVEEVPRQCMRTFQNHLGVLSEVIEDRNAAIELPYPYLRPESIENSVTI